MGAVHGGQIWWWVGEQGQGGVVIMIGVFTKCGGAQDTIRKPKHFSKHFSKHYYEKTPMRFLSTVLLTVMLQGCKSPPKAAPRPHQGDWCGLAAA